MRMLEDEKRGLSHRWGEVTTARRAGRDQASSHADRRVALRDFKSVPIEDCPSRRRGVLPFELETVRPESLTHEPGELLFDLRDDFPAVVPVAMGLGIAHFQNGLPDSQVVGRHSLIITCGKNRAGDPSRIACAHHVPTGKRAEPGNPRVGPCGPKVLPLRSE